MHIPNHKNRFPDLFRSDLRARAARLHPSRIRFFLPPLLELSPIILRSTFLLPKMAKMALNHKNSVRNGTRFFKSYIFKIDLITPKSTQYIRELTAKRSSENVRSTDIFRDQNFILLFDTYTHTHGTPINPALRAGG